MRLLPLVALLAACNLGVTGDGESAAETRNLSPSTTVRLAGPFDMTVRTDGSLDVAEIECDSNLLEHIVTELEGSELVVRVANGVSIRPTVRCHVDLKLSQAPSALGVSGSGHLDATGRLPALQDVDVSGSGSLSLVDGADICDLDAKVSGSGELNLGALDGCFVHARVSGSGTLTATGLVDELEGDLSGSGALELEGVSAERAEIDVSGSGRGWFTVTSTVDASISGSGRVVVYGEPTERDVSVSGSGNVSFE